MDYSDTALVTLCNEKYFNKAVTTIIDIREKGDWKGTIVLIAVDFVPTKDFCSLYNIEIAQFPKIPTDELIEIYKKKPLSIPTHDNREFNKVTQWEKLHVFDTYFKKWKRVMFVDAGLRILDSLDNFLSLDYKDKFLALDDTWNDKQKGFSCQLERKNSPETLKEYIDTFGDVLYEKYFLNCLWIYDTSILKTVTKQEMIDTMNKYPLWRTNEMGVMNTLITFKYKLWQPLPLIAKNGKYLFDWCELNRSNTKWFNYCGLKYAVTI